MQNTLTKLFNTVVTLVPGRTIATWHPEEVVTTTTYYTVDEGGFEIQRYPVSIDIIIGGFGVPPQAFDDDGNFLGYYIWVPKIITHATTTTQTIPGYYSYEVEPDRYVPVYDPNLGWNAGAVSLPSLMGDGMASVSVRVDSTGVVTGLNEITDSGGSDYFEISYGLYFSKGSVKVMESGVAKSSSLIYNSTDLFTITRTNGLVFYAKNTAVFYQSQATSTAELVLDASLYAGGDCIIYADLAGPAAVIVSTGAAVLTAVADMQAEPQASSELIAAATTGFSGGYSTGDLYETATAALVAVAAMTFNGVYVQGAAVYASGRFAASTEVTVIKAFGNALLAAVSSLRLGGGYVTGALKDLSSAVLIAAAALASNGAYATGNDAHRSVSLTAVSLLSVMQASGVADCQAASSLFSGNYTDSTLYDTETAAFTAITSLTQRGYYSTSSLHDTATASVAGLSDLVFNGVYTIDDAVYTACNSLSNSALTVIKEFGSVSFAAQSTLTTTGNYAAGQLQDTAQASVSGLSVLGAGGYGVGGYSDTGSGALVSIASVASNGAYTTGNDLHRMGSLTASSTLTVIKTFGTAALVAEAPLQPPLSYTTGTLSEAGTGALAAHAGLVFNGVYTLNQLQDSGSASAAALSTLALTGVYTIDNAVYSPATLSATATLTNWKGFGSSDSIAVADLQCTGIVGIGGLYDTGSSVLSSSAILTQNGYALGTLTESGNASLTSSTALVFNGAYTNGTTDYRTCPIAAQSVLNPIKTFGSANLQAAATLQCVGVYGVGGYSDSGASAPTALSILNAAGNYSIGSLRDNSTATLSASATILHTGDYTIDDDVYSRTVILTALSDVNVIKAFGDGAFSEVATLTSLRYVIDDDVHAGLTPLASLSTLAISNTGISQGTYDLTEHSGRIDLTASAQCSVVKAFGASGISAITGLTQHSYRINNDAHARAVLGSTSSLTAGSSTQGAYLVNQFATAELSALSAMQAAAPHQGIYAVAAHAPLTPVAASADCVVIKAFGEGALSALSTVAAHYYTIDDDVHANTAVTAVSALTGNAVQGINTVNTLASARFAALSTATANYSTAGTVIAESHAPNVPIVSAATVTVIKAFGRADCAASSLLGQTGVYTTSNEVHAGLTVNANAALQVTGSHQGAVVAVTHGLGSSLADSTLALVTDKITEGQYRIDSHAPLTPLTASAQIVVIKAFAQGTFAAASGLTPHHYRIDNDVHAVTAYSGQSVMAILDRLISQGVYGLDQHSGLALSSVSALTGAGVQGFLSSQSVVSTAALSSGSELKVIKAFADAGLTATAGLTAGGYGIDNDVYVLPVALASSAAMNTPFGVQGFIQVSQHSTSILSATGLASADNAHIVQAVIDLTATALPQTLTATGTSTVAAPHTGFSIASQHVAVLAMPASGQLQVIKEFGSAEFTATSTLTGSGHHVTEIAGRLRSMTALATSGYAWYAAINAQLPALTGHAAIGEIIKNFSYSAGVMQEMTGTAHAAVGGTTVDTVMSLPSLTLLASDRAYAEINVGMAPLYAFGWASTTDEVTPTTYSGCAAIIGENTQGSGSLLWDGRYLLTVAHVVEGISASDYDNITIKFNSTLSIPRPRVVDIILHPGWDGSGDHDLALVVLESAVPETIERYRLYTGHNEVGDRFHRAGYSAAVNPTTGVTGGLVWHNFDNHYEALIDAQNSVTDSNGDYVFRYMEPGTQLVFDYDNGTVARDVLGGLLGLNQTGIASEGGTRPGDSGSGAFIQGKIAGVARALWEVSPYDINAASGTYGEISNDMRVSHYADWISGYVDASVQTFAHNVRLTLPAFSIAGRGHEVAPSSAGLTLEGFTLEALGGGRASLGFTALSLTATGVSYANGAAEIALTGFTVQGAGRAIGIGYGTAALGKFTLAGLGGGSFETAMPAFAVTGSGTLMPSGAASLSMPAFAVTGSGSQGATGYAQLHLPAFTSVWGHVQLTVPDFSLTGRGQV
jgi:hypothetical protein